MSEWYLVLKFVHVACVIVWLGGLVAVALANVRLVRADDPAALRVVTRLSEFFGKAVFGPAAGLALLSGLGLMPMLHEGFRPWMAWGLVAWIASIAFGATLMRRASIELARLSATSAPEVAAVARARRRLGLLQAINLVVLATVVLAMVAKP